MSHCFTESCQCQKCEDHRKKWTCTCGVVQKLHQWCQTEGCEHSEGAYRESRGLGRKAEEGDRRADTESDQRQVG